jgi:integrase
VDARKRCDELRRLVDAGRDPLREAQAHGVAPTFEDVAKEWITWKRKQGRAESYITRSEERLAKDVKPAIGKIKAADVSKLNVMRILERIAERRAPYEVNRVRALLRAILRWATQTGRIEINPAADLPKMFDEKPCERVFNDDEVKRVWDAIGRGPGLEGTKVAMKLCLALGQRPREIVRIRKDKLVLEGPAPTMTIVAEDAKNRREHIVPLGPLAVELFQKAVALSPVASPWVFPSPKDDRPIGSHALTMIVSRKRRQSGGKAFGLDMDARLYDCKRTVATGLGDLGYPDEMIGRLLNHKKRSVTGRHYNHAIYLRERREMILAWEGKLRQILGLPISKTAPLAVPLRTMEQRAALENGEAEPGPQAH